MDIASTLHLAVFLVDTVLVAAAAWLVVNASGHARHGALEAAVAWLWAAVALVAGTGIILGQIGHLHANGFLFVHVVVLSGLVAVRRKRLASDTAVWVTMRQDVRAAWSAPGSERWGAVGLIVSLAVLLALAAWAEPVVYDGLTYRLPRIGAWLQSGHIAMLDAQDPRLNYMPVVPDIVMAWLLTATTSGYHFVAIAQAIGGVMTVAATVGLARESGLSRRAALLAGGLLFGMANVASQFTSTHTDLFTAGVLAAAIYLGWRALRRGEVSWVGAAGAGLAVAAKGTVFYFAPGIGLWIVWLGWHHRLGVRAWRRLIIVAVLGVAFFAGPGFARNWRAYGSLFGPAESIRMHQRLPNSTTDLAQKLALNLLATLAQVFDPNSQPAGLRDASRRAGGALAAHLPMPDDDSFEARGRRATLEEIMARREPDADVTSFGLVTALLLMAGGVIAARRHREPAAQLMLVWIGGVLAFVIFFNAIQQWHGYGFRFYVLAAPWMAVISAWTIAQLDRWWRIAVAGATLTAAATTAWFVLMHTHQIGWRAIMQPAQSRGYYIYQNWHDWSRTLESDPRTLTVALPVNLPLAAFYRQPEWRRVVLAPEPPATILTAGQWVPPDHSWVVVTAGRFLGRERNVAVRTWLFKGDETSLFSLAAYRRLRPGEQPSPVLYRHLIARDAREIGHDLLVKTGGAPSVRFALRNPGRSPRTYVVLTPLARTGGRLAAGESVVVTTALSAETVSEVKIIFAPGGRDEAGDSEPAVALLPGAVAP